jgi:hypothetical protein
MITVYNPISGEWERVDDVSRPFPVVARDSRLVIANETTVITPTFSSSSAPSQTDMFGNTDSNRANIGIAVGSTVPDIVLPDAWRIRRFVVVCNRTSSGSTNVGIVCTVWSRLVAPDGTPTSGWRTVSTATDTTTYAIATRFAIPSSLAGINGYDQYRITFRRDTDTTPPVQLSNIRVYVEF